MKKNILLFFLLASFAGYAQTVKTISNTDIKEVKIYLNGAQVIREVKASVDAGTTQLAVQGLSEYINNNSITVTGTGDATLLSVVSQMDYVNATKKSPRLQSLQDSLEDATRSLDKINDLSAIFMGEQDMLNANKSVGGANIGVDRDNLREVEDYYREKMIELKVKLLDNKAEQKKLGERVQRLKQQVDLLSAEENRPTTTVFITMDAKQKTNLSLELSYLVSGAGWTPQYDIRATDATTMVQLIYKANVYQRTGEQWNNVKLKLSTGNPTQNGNKPELYPWYLDFYQPRPVFDANNVMTGVELESVEVKSYKTPIADKKTEEINTTSSYTTAEQSQLNVDFNIAIPYSIPPDGKKNLVDVQSFSLPSIYSYAAVPKLDKDAFLIARIIGWDALNLLSGQANVYFNGSFTGNSYINTRSTDDTLTLSLGRDKRITITREKKKELSSTKMMGSNIVKEFDYLITVRNGKRDAIKITLEDQLPVSQNNDIAVRVGDYDGAEYNAETGKVKWNLDIPAGGVVSKKLNFSVKYPKNKPVEGL